MGSGRYTAFLSYSHRDADQARWLHRRLEAYRLPRRLVGTEGDHGPVPARLAPIFRDREELPAAGDLSETVRAALAVSDHLIVVCSPNSAASPWVAREIAVFRELHPGRPILAAIVDGEPTQCFPAGLADGTEPLAADLRPGHDGRRLGFLKLVAGLAGVGLDALIQRDAARRLRRVTYVTAGAVAAMLVMAIMTTLALTARAEAQRQRAEAEGLVEFMLTDLRDKLKGVKRLDVFAAVNERALRHYSRQDLQDLPVDALERRARLLHAMGEDDLARGHSERALLQFREAARTTASLLAGDPQNPDRVFAHAQSEFWLGSIHYQSGRPMLARISFQKYKDLAERLVEMGPGNADWLKEAGYANGSLCSLYLEEPFEPSAALALCSEALSRMERAHHLTGSTPSTLEAILNRHLWMMKAWDANGRWDRAVYHKQRQETLMEALLRADPANMDYQDIWMRAQVGIAELLISHGERAEARQRLGLAAATANRLRKHDPANADWRSWQQKIQSQLKQGE
ncbi:MAG TPA: TIR domain-containing protein [Allosphingosinicella sp.]